MAAGKKLKKAELDRDGKVRELRYLREEVAGMGERIKILQSEIVEDMKSTGDEYAEVDGRRTTMGTRTTTNIDPFGLREDLTDDQWRSVTSIVLDNKKLEAAVQAREVPLEVVQKHTTFKESDPFLTTR